jgi:hypothetical protein
VAGWLGGRYLWPSRLASQAIPGFALRPWVTNTAIRVML